MNTTDRRHNARRSAVAVALLCAFASARSLATNGVETIGVGQHALSRGGVDAAVGDSAFSQILNPATLTFRQRTEIGFGVQTIFPVVRFQNGLNDDLSRIHHIEIPSFALVVPVNDRFAWGIECHGRAGLATDFKFRYLYPPLLKREHTSLMTVPGFGINAAFKINERFSVGAGLRGEVMMINLNAALGPMNLEIKDGMGFGIGFQLGATCKPTERLTLGLAYHSPTWFQDMRSDKLEAQVFPLRIPLGKGAIDQPRMPQKIIFGASYDVTQRWRIMGETRWVNYSQSFLHDGVIAAEFMNLRAPLHLKYKDSWIFGVGTEYDLTDEWTISAGYAFGLNPTRDTHILPATTAGVVEHHLTAGLRYDKGSWYAGIAWIHAFNKTVRGEGVGGLPVAALPISRDYGDGAAVSHAQDSIVVGVGFRF